MESRLRTLIAGSLMVALGLLWLGGSRCATGGEGVEVASGGASLTPPVHATGRPVFRRLPSGPAPTSQGLCMGVVDEIEKEEDGPCAVWASIWLVLQPVDSAPPPSSPLSVEPERANTLFLSLRRFRC